MASFFDNKARAAAAASSSKTKPAETVATAPRLQPWVEKWRPKSLEDVRGQEHATEILRKMVNSSNLPHLLISGPPGNGKSSTILALCRELFGPELLSSRVLELNASDDRSISVVRDRVRSFASLHLVNAPASKEYRERYPCPPIKIVILDECDNLTQDAQSALRRVMEIHSKTTRFCLICNFSSRIIEPISSRCSKFRFKALGGEQASERLVQILSAEKVKYESDVIDRVLEVSNGDLRRAITLLQSASRLIGAAGAESNGTGSTRTKRVVDDDEEMEDVDDSTQANSSVIKVRDIDEIAGVFPRDSCDHLVKILQKGSARNYKAIAAEITDITASGYSANEVLLSLYNKIIFDDLVDSKKKYKLTSVMSDFDKRLIDGMDEQLAMLDLSCQIAGILA